MTRAAPSSSVDPIAARDADARDAGFGARVRRALIWRSGGQIVTQLLSWTSTLMVVRLLDPADYGLFAMTQAVIAFMQFLNGYGLVSALVQSDSIDEKRLRQAFGLMLLLNGGLALAQIALAPVAASYYQEPRVADLLCVQALIYLTVPFTSLPEVLMGRSLEFRRPAFVNLAAGVVAAVLAISGALAGWGVWTLVWAPIAGFYVRAIGYVLVTRLFIRPSFDFGGAGPMIAYAGSLLGGQVAFLVISQADIFIGGRVLGAHTLGLYAEALFLVQIFVSRFVPPLNEVAFPLYARMQDDRPRVAATLARTIRLLMLAACPLYLGIAVTAEPLVLTLLGPKWTGMADYVRLLALAMPFMTVQVMFPPMMNALGRPGLSAKVALAGAVILPVAFLIGIRFGAYGLACAWTLAYPLYALLTARVAGRLVGLSLAALARAVAPGFAAAAAMAGLVLGADALLPAMPAPARLSVLVGVGVAGYALCLRLVAGAALAELLALVRGRGGALGGILSGQQG